MKGFSRITLVILVILVIIGFSSCGTYNKMVEKQENVESQWGNVQNAYQARMDKIPNLVNTVKGSADFEKSTLEAVIQARANATQVTNEIDPDKLTPENIQKFQAAQGQLSSSLSRLLVTVEQYPTLRSTEAFRDLMAEISGIENRINVERNKFNQLARDYNVTIKRFPGNIMAGIFGFDEKGYFESEAGADKAPKVDFGTDK